MFRDPKNITRLPTKSCVFGCENGRLPIFKCEFCGEGWESETEVYIHKKTHFSEVTKLLESKKQLCYYCIKPFATESDLVKHIKTFHFLSSEDAKRVEREVFICDICEQIFLNKTMLIAHFALCHKIISRQNQKLKCPISTCKKHVACKHMPAHLFSHSIQSLMTCPICFLKCSNWCEYQEHVETHKKYLYCDICGATFTYLKLFKDHTAEHSTNPQIEQNIVTGYGKYFSPTYNRLFFHQKIRVHKGYRMQDSLKICILCREICSNEKELMIHIRQHYVLKSYRVKMTNYHNCEKCGEEFTYKILLKQHKTKCDKIKTDLEHQRRRKVEEYEVPVIDYQKCEYYLPIQSIK